MFELEIKKKKMDWVEFSERLLSIVDEKIDGDELTKSELSEIFGKSARRFLEVEVVRGGVSNGND